MSKITVFAGISDPAALSPWADEDNFECGTSAEGLQAILRNFSYSSSWISEACRSAQALGCYSATAAAVLFE